MSINVADIQKLREQTGAGMMDCKKALTESDGDLDKATDWLRKKGLAAAAKKASRVAAEGVVCVLSKGKKAVLVEINSETDFVARNTDFQEFAKNVAEISHVVGHDLGQILDAKYKDKNVTVKEELVNKIAVIGENLTVRRAISLSVDNGVVASYVHSSVAPGMGKIGVIVCLESNADSEKLEQFGKQLAMHIAAAKPTFLSADHVDEVTKSREREIAIESFKNSGKPQEVIEKMVEGKVNKFLQETSLLNQLSVFDNKTSIKSWIEEKSKELNSPIKVTNFVMYVLGEGIEKEKVDFAAEVASMSKN